LAGISAHFGSIGPAKPMSPADSLLHAIDRAMVAFAADPQRDRR
jgi:hypothetical protein